MKKKCYDCKHRGSVPGSCHSSCNHPANTEMKKNNMLGVLAMMGAVNMSGGILSPGELNIKANSHGVKSGWFNFPFDFDPTWLENCDGFEEKENTN